MKRVAINKDVECLACLNCEIVCSEAFYKTVDRSLTCIKIISKGEDPKILICVQCGKCAKVCPEDALKQNAKGVYMIDKKKCTDCGKCVEECPFGVIISLPGRGVPTKCTACGICIKACPADVLYMKEA